MMQAGFEDPVMEVHKRVAEKASTCGSVKELLSNIKPYTSPEFHAALSDALASVEAEVGGSVPLDAKSQAYAKFAERVKVRAGSSSGLAPSKWLQVCWLGMHAPVPHLHTPPPNLITAESG